MTYRVLLTLTAVVVLVCAGAWIGAQEPPADDAATPPDGDGEPGDTAGARRSWVATLIVVAVIAFGITLWRRQQG